MGAAPAQAVLGGCCTVPARAFRGEQEGWGWQGTSGSAPRRALWKREMLSQHERNIRNPLGGHRVRLPKNTSLREEDEGLANRNTFTPRAANCKLGRLWPAGSAHRGARHGPAGSVPLSFASPTAPAQRSWTLSTHPAQHRPGKANLLGFVSKLCFA